MILIAVIAGILMSATSGSFSPVGAATHTVVGDSRGPAGDGHGEADGAIPDGTTVFDQEVAGVAGLNADLAAALRQAATAASVDGIVFTVESAWRSPEYQEHLLDEAVERYGSREEASRWVATPTASAHVSGDAIDIASADAMDWLSRHGAAYGLCPIYANEPWHYELRPEAIRSGCPTMYRDASQDPRMWG